MANNPLVDLIRKNIILDAETSRMSLGKLEIAYHCERFATRVTKGMEDIIGIDQAAEMIRNAAATNMYDSMINGIGSYPQFLAMSIPQRLDTYIGIYKVVGFGDIDVDDASGCSTMAHSHHSFLAEGYLENMAAWQWKPRQVPFCHEMCGYIQALFAIATQKELAAITVRETECRTMGKESCIFKVEVN
jgi:hypothetical protein